MDLWNWTCVDLYVSPHNANQGSCNAEEALSNQMGRMIQPGGVVASLFNLLQWAWAHKSGNGEKDRAMIVINGTGYLTTALDIVNMVVVETDVKLDFMTTLYFGETSQALMVLS